MASLVLLTSLVSSCGSEDSTSASTLPPPSAGSTPSPSPTGGQICSQVYVYGIVVRVKDSSGNPISNAQVEIQDGDYTETLSQVDVPSPTGIYQGAGERAGTYRLTVSAPGYVTQTFDNLVVTKGVCHVSPVNQEVTLLPA